MITYRMNITIPNICMKEENVLRISNDIVTVLYVVLYEFTVPFQKADSDKWFHKKGEV